MAAKKKKTRPLYSAAEQRKRYASDAALEQIDPGTSVKWGSVTPKKRRG